MNVEFQFEFIDNFLLVELDVQRQEVAGVWIRHHLFDIPFSCEGLYIAAGVPMIDAITQQAFEQYRAAREPVRMGLREARDAG